MTFEQYNPLLGNREYQNSSQGWKVKIQWKKWEEFLNSQWAYGFLKKVTKLVLF